MPSTPKSHSHPVLPPLSAPPLAQALCVERGVGERSTGLGRYGGCKKLESRWRKQQQKESKGVVVVRENGKGKGKEKEGEGKIVVKQFFKVFMSYQSGEQLMSFLNPSVVSNI